MEVIPYALMLMEEEIQSKQFVWDILFLSLGFCKICFSLVSGLSSVAMVYVKPENSDMLTLSIILGLLAPVISFSIASGAGIGALNTLSYAGQGFGLSTGIAPVPMGTGPGGSGVPPTALANSQQKQDGKIGDSGRN
jgi:hypothetical protein